MPSTTTHTATATPTPTHSNGGNSSSGPTSSPLLFFVALGFGVVFTNLWIIVGVKYCFRYNQRGRQARGLNENGDPIDLAAMGARPHRRRREKKLMSMEEVNERFPLTKYKTWRSTREAEGLPAAGGVTAPPSRAASLKDGVGTVDADGRPSGEDERPTTALGLAQQDHANATSAARPSSPDATAGASSSEKSPVKDETEVTASKAPEPVVELARNESVITIDEEEDEDDPIRTAAPPEMLAVPGDTCAICLDTLEDDDDVRGLTCGHAFHGSCVDPWLTSRRACCPLCKADYYIPKPRADGTEDPNAPTGRRSQIQHPPAVWIGGRAGMAFGRPRLMFAGPRFFLSEEANRGMYSPSPAQRERMRREQDSFHQDPAAEREQQETATNSRWATRLPSFHLPSFVRRSQQASGDDQAAAEETTAGDLEAGTRR